jgi:hypothetical protein
VAEVDAVQDDLVLVRLRGVAAAITEPFMVVTVVDRSEAWPMSR